MILEVSHVSTYRYVAPVRGTVQSLRLTPSVFDGQRTEQWEVTVDSGQKGGAFRDGAGDWVEGWSVRGPVDSVTVRVQGRVETEDLTGMLRGHRESVPPEAYLRQTGPTRADAALTDLAHAAGAPARDRLDRAHRLSAAVSDAIAYRPGATEAHTTAAEALALGEGVCQDHAHALIAAARVLGMPARYVSGYLHIDSADDPNEAAHAWAELWVESLGWIGFDAANRCCPDDRYIRLGSGYDSRDAAPIRGIARGRGGETLDVSVAVRQAAQ
ncbi:MAG: transglutaminase domain-containing protein [Paracoccaceae bacterium]